MTLDAISLAALLLVIGIIVDDSVIVAKVFTAKEKRCIATGCRH